MGDAIISRRGGTPINRTTSPSINFVSKTNSDIVVTFTNNDAAEAEVYYGITSTLTDTVTLAAAATSNNITFSGLDGDTAFTVSAYALVTDPTSKKIKSDIATTVITTDVPIFTAATGGTTLEYDSGGKRFRSHTFTSNDNFVVSTVGTGDLNRVDYLTIAGGGGGGAAFPASPRYGGGGGAGGYRTTNGISGGPNPTTEGKFNITATTFAVVVGAGGVGSSENNIRGSNGGVSSVFGINTTGGGGGGSSGAVIGLNGGSGGGGGATASGGSGGSGTVGQGFNGGSGSGVGGGGGGGAGTAGATGSNGAAGGNGLANLLRIGTNETRSFGGNGSISNTNLSGLNASINTGDGGGGGGTGGNGGAGGSGLVIIRYEIAPSV